MTTPNLKIGIPNWCHMHGSKMSVRNFDQENSILVLDSSAATVVITKGSSMFPGHEGWFVDWKVVQSAPQKVGVQGRAWFSDQDIKSAFGLSNISGKYDHWLIEQYGADVAEQGRYIRWKNYLNIPCPGTAHYGDPNVSIHLEENIRNAVQKLISEGKKL